jgi:6-pyruvoyltetrahydropterin/6-carboxytetrahydropterin synthase
MRTQAIRLLKFDAGHRVVNHESKCRTLHGHEYKIEVYCEAACLDELGRVVDFSVIKTVFGAWVDEYLDHTMILWEIDPDIDLLEACKGAKPIFKVPFNPTAENLAEMLLVKANKMLAEYGVTVPKIRLWETSNCYVEVFK